MEPSARFRPQLYPPRTSYGDGTRQAFHRPRTSLGAAGHWIHLLSVAAPLVIGEAVKDADTRWRAMRGVAVGTAILSEAVWTWRIAQDRKKDERAREALASCEERGRAR
jgi:hypothetical protein